MNVLRNNIGGDLLKENEVVLTILRTLIEQMKMKLTKDFIKRYIDISREVVDLARMACTTKVEIEPTKKVYFGGDIHKLINILIL